MKLIAQDTFLGLITDAIFVKKRPACLFTHCELDRQRGKGTRTNMIVPDLCSELESGGNITQVEFVLANEVYQNYYSDKPSPIVVVMKIITLLGSLLGLRPLLTNAISGIKHKLVTYIPHIKTLVVILILIPLNTMGTLYSVPSWFGVFEAFPSINLEFLQQQPFISLLNVAVTIVHVASVLIIQVAIAYNAGFFLRLKHIHWLKASYWKHVVAEPFEQLARGWRQSHAFKFSILFYIFGFNFMFIQLFMLIIAVIIWKVGVSSWWWLEMQNKFADDLTQPINDSFE